MLSNDVGKDSSAGRNNCRDRCQSGGEPTFQGRQVHTSRGYGCGSYTVLFGEETRLDEVTAGIQRPRRYMSRKHEDRPLNTDQCRVSLSHYWSLRVMIMFY